MWFKLSLQIVLRKLSVVMEGIYAGLMVKRVTQQVGNKTLSMTRPIMSHKPDGWGTYCFLCGSRRRRPQRQRPHCFFSVRLLLNQRMNFYQTCIYTLLGVKN